MALWGITDTGLVRSPSGGLSNEPCCCAPCSCCKGSLPPFINMKIRGFVAADGSSCSFFNDTKRCDGGCGVATGFACGPPNNRYFCNCDLFNNYSFVDNSCGFGYAYTYPSVIYYMGAGIYGPGSDGKWLLLLEQGLIGFVDDTESHCVWTQEFDEKPPCDVLWSTSITGGILTGSGDGCPPPYYDFQCDPTNATATVFL